MARAGDVILSLRNLSTVLLFRPSTGEVVWLATGPWLNQHDVNLLPDGRYSVFGNDMVRVGRRFVTTDGVSDIYIYDPATGAIEQPYRETFRDLNALTETAGRSRILDNGDAFAEIHDAAQLVRISADTVRWVFVNGVTDETVGLVHWARYLEEDELDLSWLSEQSMNGGGGRMHFDPLMMSTVVDLGSGDPELLMAYVGPGLGGGVVAVIVGFLVSIVLALTAVFWYPLKRLYRAVRGLFDRDPE